MKYLKMETSKRPFYINVIVGISILLCSILLPDIFALSFHNLISNKYICTILGSLCFLIIIIFIYLKDLKTEAKKYFKNFKENFGISFKYYILGIVLMIVFNYFIYSIYKNTSLNESTVRDMLFKSPFLMFIEISIMAPLVEELSFRKTLDSFIKNNILFALMSGLLFGGAHILTNIISGSFIYLDLLYILPYGSLGFCFAIMNRETKSTFSSIVIHSMHNTVMGILLLMAHFMGGII